MRSDPSPPAKEISIEGPIGVMISLIMKNKLKHIYYRVFGKYISDFKNNKRAKLYGKINGEKYRLEIAFRKFESALRGIEYPNNEFNEIMSMVLSDLELFGFIVSRFRHDRMILSNISREDQFIHFLDFKRKSYRAHPLERRNNQAIKVDTQSLFVFGIILVNRLSFLLKMYLPDRSTNSKIDMYSKIGLLYSELNKATTLSKNAQKFKNKFLLKIKWLSAVLRFYRNEFIEHLDRGYQQGMNFGTYTSDFALTSYKRNYNDIDNETVEMFREKLEKLGVKISGRSDGGRSLINRYYIQNLFDNIILVPDSLLSEALDLIEDIGVHSPQPEKVIKEVEEYVEEVFNFMVEELGSSEVYKFKKS